MSDSVLASQSQRAITVSAPAAGAEWSWAAPIPCRLLSARALLTASSATGSRFPGIELVVPGGQHVYLAASVETVAPSTAASIGYLPGSGFQGPQVASGMVNLPAPNFVLLTNSVLTSRTPGLDTADQYSAIFLLIET